MKIMRKTMVLALGMAAVLSMTACSGGGTTSTAPAEGGDSSTAEVEAWEPSKNITFAVASGAGGGSDLFTRKIAEIFSTKEIIDKTIIVSNETDGGGEIVRNRVANAQNDDHLILAFMSGAIGGMVANTDLRMDSFTPLGVIAADQSLFFKGEHSKYETIEDFIAAAQAGEEIVIGGSKNDDILIKNKFLTEIGVPIDANVEYIIYDSTSDALVALLGGHIELCIGKPAASMEYVKADKIQPVLAFSAERFAEPLSEAPILSEVGDFENVEIALWRGIVGPGGMDPAARDFYVEAVKQVAESEEWLEYCEMNLLTPLNITGDDAVTYMMEAQKAVEEAAN